MKKSTRDNRANQLNPHHPAYYRSRGASAREARQMARNNHPSDAADAAQDGPLTASNPSSEQSE